MFLVAIGCGRIPEIVDISKKQSFVVFGTMDDKTLSHFNQRAESIADTQVYFYETG